MIYECRDSRDGHVFATEYGMGASASKMMYVAACYGVPMCCVEWRRYMGGTWSEWRKLVPELDGQLEYQSWFFPDWSNWSLTYGAWHGWHGVFDHMRPRYEFDPPYMIMGDFTFTDLGWNKGLREYCSWFCDIGPVMRGMGFWPLELPDWIIELNMPRTPWWRRIF